MVIAYMTVWDYPIRYTAGVLFLITAVAVGSRMFRSRARGVPSTSELIRIYRKPGGDEFAVQELRKKGAPARDELISELASARPDQHDDAFLSAIVGLLREAFPCDESRAALDRLRGRTSDPTLQRELLRASTQIRASVTGQLAKWLNQPPGERPDYNEMLLDSATPADRLLLLPEIAWYEWKIGHSDRAEALAREMLGDPDLGHKTGDGVYYANVVLGMIALRKDDVPTAKHYLIEAARTPGSPWLSQGTQDMGLALELLRLGEREAVLDYLELSKRFWKRDLALLDRWQTMVRSGDIPNFDRDRIGP
jgi:hypothetical protein